MKTTICLLVIFNHLLLESLVDGTQLIKSLQVSWAHRVKRAWSYPQITIPESVVEDGSFVTVRVATIKSSNAQIARYEFGEPMYAAFTLETVGDSGIIKQVQPLDREQQANYYLTALVLDASGTLLEDPAIIQVVVSDENDNNPIFDQKSLKGVVFENQTSGGFMTLVASDKDSSYREYHKVRFYYVGNEDPPADSPRFIVSRQGVVSVIGQLDAETVPIVTFEVEAKDGAINAKYRSTVKETITVTVGDSNDNAPIITDPPPYVVTRGELTPVSSALFEVSTTDADQGVNKATYYKITSGNLDGTFSMKSYPSQTNDPSRGEIILDKPLDYESGITSYVLIVVAYNKDASNPNDVAYQTSIQVTINVADENEPPEFLNVPYTANVIENVASIPLTTVQAQDKDFGETQWITFTLLNGNGWFDITGDGEISVISAIDRENPLVDQATSIFKLRVKATDNYDPAASSETEVSVFIGDVNDNAPHLATQSEHIMVCQYPPTKIVPTSTIVDEDTSSNGPPFTYSTNEAGWFMVQTSDYKVWLLTELNELPLSTNDSFTEVPITITDTAKDGSPSMTGTSTVTIQVCRCDDGKPACGKVAPVAYVGLTWIIAVIAGLLLLLIIVVAVVTYRLRQKADLKLPSRFIDDKDVSKNSKAYLQEGGDEEGNDDDGISTSSSPMMAPPRPDDVPRTRAAPQPRNIPPGTAIDDYIADAQDQAYNDLTAPP